MNTTLSWRLPTRTFGVATVRSTRISVAAIGVMVGFLLVFLVSLDFAHLAPATFLRFLFVIARAFSVPIESERRLYLFILTRSLDANRYPLRWKTL